MSPKAHKLHHLSPKPHRLTEKASLIRRNQAIIPLKIDLMGGNNPCLMDEFPDDVQHGRDAHHSVVAEEVVDFPMSGQEDGVAVGEDDEDEADEADVGRVGLEPARVGEAAAVEALHFAGLVEGEVGDGHGDEVDEAAGRDEVRQPG